MADEVLTTQSQIRDLRALIRNTPESFPSLVLLDQYLGILYVDFLSRIRQALEEFNGTTEGHLRLRKVLDELQAQEVFEGEDLSHLESAELEGLHVSRLKKFFQSELFLDVSQKQALKRVAEPMAAAAALVAGGLVGGVEHFMKLHGWMLGVHSIIAVSLGMALYAVKDRLKDRGKAFLTSTLAKRFPDIERELFVNGQVLGKIGEWYSMTKMSLLPNSVRDSRYEARSSDLERHLPEEILHYHKSILCSTQSTVRENLRINLHRYLRHMDEPQKMVRRLMASGQIESVSQPRVYHVYATILVDQTDIQTHRIVMDKTGIIRCETVKKAIF